MNSLFSSLVKKRRVGEVVGIEMGDEGLSLIHLTDCLSATPTLEHCEFISNDSGSDQASLLAERIKELGLENAPCRLALGRGRYQFLLVDAPKVPAAELTEALRWQVKDLVDFPIDNAVLDAFLLPHDSARITPMAYVAVAENSTITAAVEAISEAKLDLQSIDIAELCLRNVAVRNNRTTKGLALVHLVQDGGSLQIIRNNQIYLSRQFDLDYNGGLLDDIPEDALALELQRSQDYYERQMRQMPPEEIVFCGENITADKLTLNFQDNFSASVSRLNIEEGLTVYEPQKHILPLCLLALGAALRESTELHAVSEGLHNV